MRLLFCGLLLCAACALAPGMRMDEGAAEDRGRKQDASYKVEPITPALLQQLEQQRARENPLLPDPDAGAPAAPYTVAPYDVLQVTVWDHPELTTPAGQLLRTTDENSVQNGNVVAPDGTMFYPYVGVVKVAGLTLAQIRELLTQRLASVLTRPQLDVRVSTFRGRKVQITGEVLQPSSMPLTDVPLRVQDAIAFARGFVPEADPGNVTLSREGKLYHLDLLALYEGGQTSQNWLLHDGDVINVGDRNQNRVFVLGEVKLQQAKPMVKRRMTLAEAMGDSGWFDPLAANESAIYVIRGNYQAPSIFHLDASSPDALLLAAQFQLRPRDIVFVSANAISRWNRVMAQILPTAQALYDAAIATDVARRF